MKVFTTEFPLKRYPLNELQFKGTVNQNNQTSGFILAPDNKLYQVKLDDVIGDHYGKIVNIYPDRLEVQEQVPGEAKKIAFRIITVQLKE